MDKVKEIREEIERAKITTQNELESFRIRFLGSKNIFKELIDFKTISAEERKTAGQVLNELKQLAKSRFEELKITMSSKEETAETNLDLFRPGVDAGSGSRHPISIVRAEIVDIFRRIGFMVSDGPEIEDDWHNFTALNLPEEHPARDMQDTFFIQTDPDVLLRTHTSSVQVRFMENNQPPIRTISPGRVFRNEAISARAHCIFHQIEGLYIDKDVSFADLKQTLDYFAKELFGKNAKIRLRPSYFPFTEPSAEVDVSCSICSGKGCNVCKYTGWLEIMGCGMVDPNVLRNCGIDPEVYTGFAFGMGIERIAMLKFNVNDLRHYFEGDFRFLSQFQTYLNN